MKELEEQKVKVDGETVKVYVKFHPAKGKEHRRRFYTHDALELVQKKHPRLKVGKAVKVCTAKNYGNSLEGEWVFQLIKEKVAKKRTATTKKAIQKKTLKQAKEEAKKEGTLD